MMSKEEKLRYGEELRRQMKEKEDRKKNEDVAKRAVHKVVQYQSDRALVPDPALLDQKELYRNKLEAQDYNPFGKAGSGAPNRKPTNNTASHAEQNRSVLPGYSSQEHLPARNYPQETYNEHPASYQYSEQRSGAPLIPTVDRRDYPPQHQNPTPYPDQQQTLGLQSGGNYPSPGMENQHYHQEHQQQYADPRSYNPQRQYQDPREYTAEHQQRGYPENNQRQYPERAQAKPQPSMQYQEPPVGSGSSGLYRQEYSQPQLANQRQPTNQRQLINQRQPGGQFQGSRDRVKTMENDEVQEIYKKGGRNILQLQNQTMNEHLVKQKQKQEMQAFLKQQMEEVERRKQEEKDKIKQEEIDEERRNKEYIERQNMKLKDDERKKVDERQKLVDDNLRNLARKKEMQQEAKDKTERGEREHMQRRIREELEVQKQKEKQQGKFVNSQVQQKHPRKDSSSSVSESSSSISHTKGFNTNVSREFLKKEREKDVQKGRNDKKLELFTTEIQKMRDEIVNQGQSFQEEINKIKKQAERAHDQKKKADLQVERLKLQLEKKDKESELRLLQALKRNDPYGQSFIQPPPPRPEQRQQQQHYHPPPRKQDNQGQDDFMDLDQKPYGIPSRHPPSPKKPMSKGNRVYEHQPEYPQYPQKKVIPKSDKNDYHWDKEFRPEKSLIGTLEAESKKIPLNIQSGTKLTMSSLEGYGKQSFMYGKPEPQASRFQEESKLSRGSNRGDRDELDKLVDDRNGNKWEMSTVRDDITKEIQELLKKKDNGGSLQPSTIGRSGRQVVSRGGLPYDGPWLGTLNSNKGSLVSDGGSLDVDRIHGRNEARLQQLKALGVETVNTANDDDLNRLNAILNNYR